MATAPSKGRALAPQRARGRAAQAGTLRDTQVLMALLGDPRLSGRTDCEGKSSGNLLAGTYVAVPPLNCCKDPDAWGCAVGIPGMSR